MIQRPECPICSVTIIEDNVYTHKHTVIHTLYTVVECVHFYRYHDYYGNYHSHDPNKRSSKYQCQACNHEWMQHYYVPCPCVGCDYKKESPS